MYDLKHNRRKWRNQDLAMAEKWKALALKNKRSGFTSLAIIAARQYRRCMANVRKWEATLEE